MTKAHVETPKFDEKWNLYFERLQTDGTLKRLEPIEKDYVKDLEITVLLKRSIFGNDFLPKTAYFKQILTLHVPNEKRYKYVYFRFLPKEECKNVGLCNFSPPLGRMVGITYLLDLNDAEFCRKKGVAKKITVEAARKMLIEKTALCLFNDEALTMEVV